MLTPEQLDDLRQVSVRLWKASEVVEVLSMARNWYSHENAMAREIQSWKHRAELAEAERHALMLNLKFPESCS